MEIFCWINSVDQGIKNKKLFFAQIFNFLKWLQFETFEKFIKNLNSLFQLFLFLNDFKFSSPEINFS